MADIDVVDDGDRLLWSNRDEEEVEDDEVDDDIQSLPFRPTERSSSSITRSAPEELQLTDHDCLGNIDTTSLETPYQALNPEACEIRLVKILPDTNDTIVKCQLVSHALHQAPVFTALSYTWGRPDPDCWILLNGQRFLVRKNLLRFLQEARRSRTHRGMLIWIDALCIDQSNQVERTHQVDLMSQIYKSAKQVLVWLGPRYGDSDLAMRLLAKWSTSDHVDTQWVQRLWWKAQGAALRRLCERQYWGRLWVLQEMVLASKILLVCGEQVAEWRSLAMFLYLAQSAPPSGHRDENYEYQPTLRSRAMSILKQIQRARQKATLFDQMRESQHLKCYEPRDKIYALLGIVGQGYEGISPDYTVGLPTLLNAVLRNHHQVRSPMDLINVRRQCQELAQAVGVDVKMVFQLEDQPRVGIYAPPREDTLSHRLVDFESGLILWWAALYGHKSVQTMLMQKIQRYRFDEYVASAVAKGHIDALKFWLSVRMVDVAHRDGKGHSLLSLAVINGHPAVSRLLLGQANIDVNSKDVGGTGRAAIHFAAMYGHSEILQQLLERPDVDVNAFDRERCTPLHLAIKLDRSHSVTLLLGRDDLDVNLISAWIHNPLEYALSLGRLSILESLLDRDGIEVAPSRWKLQGGPLLHQAIRMKRDDILAMLLRCRDIDVNGSDDEGNPALHVAFNNGTTDALVRLLSSSDINLRLSDSKGDTPLHLAVRHGHDDIITVMLRIYCYLGNFTASHRLLNARAYLRSLDASEETVAVGAPAAEPSGLSQYLQQMESKPYLGFEQSVEAHAKCFEPLPHHSVDINARNAEQNTPLHDAISCNRTYAAQLLLSMPGIDINVTNRHGATPLYLASTRGNIEVVQFLLMHRNIDIRIRTYAGLSPLDIAKARGYNHIFNIISMHGEAQGYDLYRVAALDITSPELAQTLDAPEITLEDNTSKRVEQDHSFEHDAGATDENWAQSSSEYLEVSWQDQYYNADDPRSERYIHPRPETPPTLHVSKYNIAARGHSSRNESTRSYYPVGRLDERFITRLLHGNNASSSRNSGPGPQQSQFLEKADS